MPGVVFHVTARVQAYEPLLEPLRASAIVLLQRYARLAQMQVVAYAIMPNHLHILAKQGSLPLSSMMQPLLTTLAGKVQRYFGRRGHVFDRRYFANPCLDPEYLRNAIAYIHLNPIRAGLCEQSIDYPWSSERQFMGLDTPPVEGDGLYDAEVIRIFASAEGQSIIQLRSEYAAFCRWRLAHDQAATAGDACHVPEPLPPLAGDLFWGRALAAAAGLAAAWTRSSRTLRPDLGDLLSRVAGDVPAELIRAGAVSRKILPVRNRFILLAMQYGTPQVRVAAFLNVSPTTVSRVVRGAARTPPT